MINTLNLSPSIQLLRLNKADRNHEPVALEEMWRRYAFIVNTSKELMALVDTDYQYKAVNESYCLARNQSREEIIGCTLSDLWGEKVFYETIKQPLDQCFSGQEVNYQAWYEHAALGLRYMDVTYYPYYNHREVVTHAVVVSRDITERAKSQQAIRRYAERLEMLHEIDRALLAAQSPKEVANVALKYLLRLVPCQQANVMMFIDDASVEHQQEPPDGTISTVDFSDIGEVEILAQVPEGTPVTQTDSANVTRVPLVVQGKLLGALSLGSDDLDAFTEEHSDIVHEVACQVAIAIQQAQLREDLHRYTTQLEERVAERTREIERRRQVAEGLHDILAILNSKHSMKEVLSYVVGKAHTLLDADAVEIFNFSENCSIDTPVTVCLDSLDLQSTYRSGLEQHSEMRLGEQTDATQKANEWYRAIVQLVIAKRQPISFDNLQEHPNQYTVWHNTLEPSSGCSLHKQEMPKPAQNYGALLAAPLMVGSELYGAIVLYQQQPTQLTSESVGLTAFFCDQAALALENARLHERAEQAGMLEERERLAQELHDSVTQSLYSLTLYAEAGQRQAKAGAVSRVREYLGQLGNTAQQALKEMRLLLYELRPVLLEQEGFLGAIRRRLDVVEKRAGVNVFMDVPEPLMIPRTLEEGLYRIAQEALNNSLKHAASQEIVVHVESNPTYVKLEVSDNGYGFDLESVGRGMGLTNMQARAKKLGGTLSIQTAPGKGTSVQVLVPDIFLPTQ